MSREPSEANKAWEDAISKGEMAWLKDTTFAAADCFLPPSDYQPHTWERIAVPPVNLSRHSGPIYKRIPGRSVDTRYNMVVAELASQGSRGRKRARIMTYKSVHGVENFDPKYKEAAATMKQEIAKARDQVKTAYKQIAKDNQALRKNARPTKPSKYDPARLAFAPRKRHNTRWPIDRPTWDKMIGECQPLIVPELDIKEIDDPSFWAQEPCFWEHIAAEIRSRPRSRQFKRSKKRRAMFMARELYTISEEDKEPSGVPAKYQPMYKAPAKRWAAAADKYFTMSATSAGVARDDGEADKAPLEITNHRGHFCVPSSPLSSRSSATTAAKRDAQDADEVTNERGCFRVPSSSVSSGTSTTTAGDRKRKAQDEDEDEDEDDEDLDRPAPVRRRLSQPAADPAAVAVFDQPTQVHAEPEHEIKRRVSLDNARRSDRSLQMTAIKKVRTWVTTTFSGRRRSAAEAMDEQEQDGQDEPPRTRRRHTLDVDVGTNPDIFGQTAGQEQEISPNINTNIRRKTKSAMLLNGKPAFTGQWDTLSDVPSEFSAVRRALDPETASTPDTTPDAPTPAPACRIPSVAFKDYDGIPNIDDSIRNLLDRKADVAFGKAVDTDAEIDMAVKKAIKEANKEAIKEANKEANKTDEVAKVNQGSLLNRPNFVKVDEFARAAETAHAAEVAQAAKVAQAADGDEIGDGISPDDTQVFDKSVEDRFQKLFEPDDDEELTTGDFDLDTTAPNPPATEPPMADSPVNGSPSHDSTVPDSPTPDLPTAMEMTVEPYIKPDPDMPLQSIEHDDAETTTAESAMIGTPMSGESAASPQPAGHSDGDSDAATGQHLEAAIPDMTMLDAPPVEQPSAKSQPAEEAEVQPDEGLAPEPTAEPQVVDAQDADSGDDSQLQFLRNFVHRATLKFKAPWSSSPKAAPSAAEPQDTPESPSKPESPSEPKSSSEPKAPVDLLPAPKSPRKALAQKDSNMSPISSKTSMSGSPGKKRKLKEVDGNPSLDMTKSSSLVKPDLEDTTPQPQRKRRRKGGESDAPDEIFNSEMSSHSLTQKGSFSGGPTRRSKRVAAPRTIVPSTPSWTVRPRGSSFDTDMPAVSTEALMLQKKEKDLAAVTRNNTRRNKGGALPPAARLTGLALPATTADPFISPEKASGSRAAGPKKGVRWAQTLAQYQGDDEKGESSSASTIAAAAASRGGSPPPAAAQTVLEQPPSPLGLSPRTHVAPAPQPPASPFASSSSVVPPESEKKKALRPRPSRLPAAVAKAPTPTPTAAPKTPKSRAASAAATTAPSRVAPTPKRRSSSVGVARLGTPAAKRRGSAKK